MAIRQRQEVEMVNNSSGLSSRSPNDYALFNNVTLSLNIAFIFIIIGGNSLTICAICRFKTLRYPSNVMIAVLALSDLLIGSVYTPLVLLRTNLPFLFTNRASCLAMMFVGKSVLLGNVGFQAVLSIERFYAVQFPYHYHSKVTVMHNLIWSLVFVGALICVDLPILCGIDLWSEKGQCYAPILFPSGFSRFYIGTFLTFQLVGLLAFLRVLVAELSFRRRDQNLQVSEMQKQASIQSTIMVLAYGISLCFYMPHVFYYLWGTVTKINYDPVTLGVVQLLDLCNSAVNCFIYGFKNSNFRMAYKSLLGLKTSQVEPLNSVTYNTTE